MSNPIVHVDEDYQHDSLDWFYRLKIKKTKKIATAIRVKGIRISDFERLVFLSEEEHADCDDECEVRKVLAALEGER